MRLDKFLKVSRIIKRRTIANEICQKGYILINDKVAKASTGVKAGDKMTINFAKKEVVYEILELKDSTKKEDAAKMFKIISEEER
ncbi:RNA-binding S4 domain-containing protein [Gemelliphila palaticanis]|uniref:RQC P-site tRNA stabilizing factor n=1 Tax=Gemelliphila palaticanis TaxID=81950 RepID=A0ABX2T3Q6_9BACL|nr:RNA-binding S4 domain-containing protein [Gemella palaticanis]MBF0715945.1 RNA-binding S4 domain-containing protein [Gemella palaticanis]NYS47875.1 RNA-binding S4 domain-containing protein [Gemella palaticanis]